MFNTNLSNVEELQRLKKMKKIVDVKKIIFFAKFLDE